MTQELLLGVLWSFCRTRQVLRSTGAGMLMAVTFGIACAAPATAQSTEILPKRSGPAHVLVLPGPSELFATELRHRQRALDVTRAGSRASSLEQLRQDRSLLEVIKTGDWDFVVLAGLSTFGKTLVIDGQVRVGDPSGFLHHGRLLVEEIRPSGARPVLLVPPRRPGGPAVDQEAVDWAYHRLGREAGASLAPVGEAFARVRRRRPDLALFDRHGEEWSRAGAFLAASVLEATVTGRFPGGSAGPEPAGATDRGLTPELRHLLNREAWATVRDLVSEGGTRDLPPPPFPAVPTLPRGEAVAPGRLAGAWRGPLRLYPWRATLELQVTTDSGALRVNGRIHFEDGRDDVSFEASDPRYEDGVLSFRNPADLANGRTLYHIVFRRSRLYGVAELATDDGGAYAVGGFELKRLQP